MRSIGSFDAIAETFYQSVQEYEGDSCEVVSTASTWVLHRECQEGYEKLQQLVRVQNNCKTVPRFRHVAFPWKCGRFCCALTLWWESQGRLLEQNRVLAVQDLCDNFWLVLCSAQNKQINHQYKEYFQFALTFPTQNSELRTRCRAMRPLYKASGGTNGRGLGLNKYHSQMVFLLTKSTLRSSHVARSWAISIHLPQYLSPYVSLRNPWISSL